MSANTDLRFPAPSYGNLSCSLLITKIINFSVCDLGFLLLYIVAESLPNAAPEVKSSYSYAAFYSWVAYPLINFFFNAGVWLVVGVTTNRFILTYYPLKGKVLCSKWRTRLGVAGILLLAALVNIPHFWNYHPEGRFL